MKNKLFLFLALFTGIEYTFAQDAVGKLELKKVTDKAFIFTTFKVLGGTQFPSNGLILNTEKGVVIIDSPWDSTQCQPLLDSIRKLFNASPLMVIATHFHDDRTGAFGFFKRKGILTYASALTDSLCIVANEKRAGRVFTKDTVFVFGDQQMYTFYPGPGHTRDNIVVYLPNEKILYGGCLVKSLENTSIGNVRDADMKAWPLSLKKVQKKFKEARYVIPGHYAFSGPEALEHTLKLIEQDR